MRKALIILLACAVVVSFVAPSFAEMPRQITKLGRGVANVISSPLEIGKQITKEWRSADSKQLAFFGGLFKGLGYTFKRLGSGLVDIVTFPIKLKDDYEPIMKPEYVFDE